MLQIVTRRCHLRGNRLLAVLVACVVVEDFLNLLLVLRYCLALTLNMMLSLVKFLGLHNLLVK